MENLDMLDPTMLMLHGLIDHPIILAMEAKRLKDAHDKKKIMTLIERCMENKTIREALQFDEDLAELFIHNEILKGESHE